MRGSGIIMHIASLPSNYGIGTFGKAAYEFVDFLEKTGQTYWQILPLGQTSYGDSPYQSFSAYGGNPYFIDLDILCKENLLKKSDLKGIKWSYIDEKVEYEVLYNNRYVVLKKAFKEFMKTPCVNYEKFKAENSWWLYDYAVFMSIKAKNNDVSWLEWEEKEKLRDEKTIAALEISLKDEIEFIQFMQYKFFEQWYKLKAYANKKNVKIVGDIPIYVSMDSSDVWTNPDEFDLDEKTLAPNKVAGCPPDAFTADGQLWGNPLYNYEKMKKNNFKWWVSRVKAASELYDITRIDHFRGFDEYYAIPYGDETARNGAWQQGPGYSLFEAIKSELGDIDIIAEDLGFMTKTVRKLLKKCKYPGMKILQFGFNPEQNDSEYFPHNLPKNCVAYTGTHDNSTVVGWWNLADKKTRKHCKSYLDVNSAKKVPAAMIKSLFASCADTVIIPWQDYMELDDSTRINIPSTLGGNWEYRCKKSDFTPEIEARILDLTQTYYRMAPKPKKKKDKKSKKKSK